MSWMKLQIACSDQMHAILFVNLHFSFFGWFFFCCPQAWSRQPCLAWTGKSKKTTRLWSRLKTWPDRWAGSREPQRSASPSQTWTTTHHASPRVSTALLVDLCMHTHTHTVTNPQLMRTTCQCELMPGRQPPSGVSFKMNLDYCRELWVLCD